MRTPPRHYGVPFLLALLASLLLPRPAPAVPTELVASGFTAPMFVAAPAGDARLFVVERAGFIRVLADGAVLPAPFLDLRRRVNTTGEGGLLGLAFAPDYAVSRAFYVYYTGSGVSRVSRFRASEADPNVANPAEIVVLEVPQPPAFINHKGGTIAFGPDGMLYAGLGDGGGSGDPLEAAQNPSTLLGKMVRIDVAFAAFTDTYRVPADNPFVGNPAVRPEIWAFGLRNPLRFGFDRETGDLYVGDVGKNTRQEIDVEPAGAGGRNYGWDVMDGSTCFEASDPGEPSCNAPTLTLPIHEYGQALGCSVTGGTVYRGSQPALRGHYLFADFCSGRIWSFVWNGAGGISGPVVDRTAELAPPPGQGSIGSIVGFGEDGAGEVYIVDSGGEVFRIVPVPTPACANGVDDDGDGLADFSGDDSGDPGCSNAEDASETDAALPCDDGVDNDGDELVDFRAGPSGDPGCGSPLWWGENSRCQDGSDNDRDSDLDFDGGASLNGGVPIGSPDAQCWAPWFPREGGGCGLGFELALVLPLLARLRRRAAHRAPPRA